MTLLIISPDYASHLYPLISLGRAWQQDGQRVVVATGPATRPIVAAFGFDYLPLELGRGSNPGVIRAEEQQAGEDDALRGFFAATRIGMVETLTFQAEARLDDLMWQPVDKARAVQAIVRDLQPDSILIDHLAFSARLGLDAMNVTYGDVVLGHPTALPIRGEVYGYPPTWPKAFLPDPDALGNLRALCNRVSDRFTDEWNAAAGELGGGAVTGRSAFEAHGELLLYNYPEELSPAARTAQLPAHTFLGSSVRAEPVDDDVTAWVTASDIPIVYVSFGSFLSVRADVLATVVAAISALGMRGAVASGSADTQELGEIPPGFLVREFLPQVALLGHAAVVVTHGGNNSVTEAVTAGTPMVVLPFSTDQFVGAAAIEDAGIGVALAPNSVTSREVASAISDAIGLTPAIRELSASVTERTGSDRAFEAMTVTSRTASGLDLPD